MPQVHDVVIVGAGLGGIAAAIELKRHGFSDVVLLDAADGVGGTWRYNDYPGAACDVPSHLYSYSFARRSTWSRLCSPREEILRYVEQVADVFEISEQVRTRSRVTACEWDDAARHWVVRTEGSGVLRAGAVVLATGQLNQPAFPAIDGLDTFAGHSFHSARWDHDYDLTGKRVAVIGTGASAVQFVPPVAEQVGRLSVFQRTGNWILPRRNNVYPASFAALFRLFPILGTIWRQLLFHSLELLTAWIRHPRTLGHLGRIWSELFMRMQLRDPETRRKAWPNYTFGCKRILFSSAFLPALQRNNVELVTEKITRMTPAGPQTEDGRVHEVDCVIYGTGFRTTRFMFPMEITGIGGRTLREAWADGPRAHLGIAVSGFPSLFVMYGPNTNTSGGSIIFFLEAQARYVRQAMQLVRERAVAAVDVRAETMAASTDAVQRRFAGTAWLSCQSWYRDASGRIVTNWPGYMREYGNATSRLDPAEFTLIERAPVRDDQRADQGR
ncbi:MAG TPA: NAD(P)/FAD-dependent oxidoreductase [Pseudonocardiaceae bacterium]|nr:NAD(P)/FAD-dependent oxidoreductase [Pseudonocardiaceae bacterium]